MNTERKWTLPPLLLSALLIPCSTYGSAAVGDEPATADAVMARAEAQAAAKQKNILLTFSASWCGNCRLFDRLLADPQIHPILDKAFIIADLDTGERPGDTRHANIPGGDQVQTTVGGKNAGYPFLVMLDPKGRPIVDSIRPASLGHGGNIGYPDAPWEIDWFLQMLQKAAPALSAQERSTIQAWLTTHSTTRH